MTRRFLSSIPRLLLVGIITADGRDKRRGLHIAYALMLYYDAMVGMVNKQKKIVEREQELDGTDHQPVICPKSRQMA